MNLPHADYLLIIWQSGIAGGSFLYLILKLIPKQISGKLTGTSRESAQEAAGSVESERKGRGKRKSYDETCWHFSAPSAQIPPHVFYSMN